MGYFGEDIDRVKRSVPKHPVSVPNCPTEIPHGMSWVGSWNLLVRCLNLTAREMVRPRILWSCLRQGGWGNVQLQIRSPINEDDQV